MKFNFFDEELINRMSKAAFESWGQVEGKTLMEKYNE